MTEFGQGHPCAGKDCRECETCIFDEDLFIDKVQPNKRKDIMALFTILGFSLMMFLDISLG